MPLLAVAGLTAFPVQGGPTVCPFALMTGVACPGCGLTRAAAAMVQGDLHAAMGLHPLVLVVAAWVIGTWVNAALRRRGRSLGLDQRTTSRLLNLTAAVFVLTWAIRIVTGTLPPV